MDEKLKRYDLDDNEPKLYPHQDGDWCKSAEVAQLEISKTSLEADKASLRAVIKALDARIAELEEERPTLADEQADRKLEARVAELEGELDLDAQLFTRDGLAALMGCSIRQLYRLEKRGDIPASFLIGSLRRWRATTVRRWMAEQEITPKEDPK